jgi:Na+-driven multidrug efflux pump
MLTPPQGIVYFLCTGPIVRAMGVGLDSPMYAPAVSYLRVRALGTPAATLWLVSNGIFRGLGDTLTPLKWSLVFTFLNAVLDPLCIFTFGMVRGRCVNPLYPPSLDLPLTACA